MSDRNTRFPANFPIVMRQGPEMYSSVICNISIGGACIVGHTGFAPGDSFVLDYAVGQTKATVIWTVGRMAGLRFDGVISNTGLDCIRAAAVPA